MKFEKFFTPEINRNQQKEDLDLEKKLEQFERNSEKLEILISNIDSFIFSENPLPIEKKKNIREALLERESISFKARYGCIEEGDKKEEKYEINKKELDKSRLSIETIFNLAVHEVRHRIQRFEERKKSGFSTF